MEVGIAASAITIAKLTGELALQVKVLVQSVKQRDENLKELEDNLHSLGIILEEAITLYGSDEGSSSSTSEQKLPQTLRKVVSSCEGDLTNRLETSDRRSYTRKDQVIYLKSSPGLVNADAVDARVSHAWFDQWCWQQANTLASVQMHEMTEMVRTLTNKPAQGTTTDTMISEVAEALEQKQDTGGHEGRCMVETSAGGQEPDDNEESNENGKRLLKAIDDRDSSTSESLLHDGSTSLKEKDDRDRTPLLLAAHLGQTDMVKKLFTNTNHHQNDFNATDKLGRTALHYCAELGMCDIAKVLLDHGVDVNARDNGGYPPAYYPVKNRKYFAIKLLLSRGATTEFKRPIPPTSHEIVQLLKKSAMTVDVSV
ncbi:MAG: hypothetical protein Q9177_004137 [Variospora cf. flavescens]